MPPAFCCIAHIIPNTLKGHAMNAPETGKTLKAQFHWDDPLLLDQC